jgi:hypothetical protein
MTDASAGMPESSERWEALLDDLKQCGQATLDRVSTRARENITRARKGEYGLNAWLDDVKWFWTEMAKNTEEVVDGLKPPEQ